MIFLKNLIGLTLPFAFLTFTGLTFTLKNNFYQFRNFKNSVALTHIAFRKREKGRKITSFKTACTALSATVGTGNIAGVAGALSIGGAGAVFWMWISALLGMCIKSAEISLAIQYREKKNGNFVGGPMYYIKNGLGKNFQFLKTIFILSLIPAVFFTGNITQTNSCVTIISENFFCKLIFGIIFAIATFIALKGGFSRIANLTETLTPVMSILYILLCGFIISKNINVLPKAFIMILKGAFNSKAVTGGAVGSFISCVFIGASRGIFSNEAGLGTSAMAHSLAVDADPETQGLFGIFEVFVDTILLCTLTALTILCSGVKINYGSYASTELMLKVFNDNYGKTGGALLNLMMCLFAFSSIIGWAFYGKLCWSYFSDKKGNNFFTLIYPLCCIPGAVFSSNFAWETATFFNGIMLCANLTALLLLNDKIYAFKKEKKSDKFKNKPSS